MKITTKTTKEQLKEAIKVNVSAVRKQDKDLFDRIAYADKMIKTDESKVTRKDLADLVKEIISTLGDKFIEPALAQEAPATPAPAEPKAENSVKKLTGKKKDSSKESGEKTATAEETEETPAPDTKKEKVGGVTKVKAEEKVDEKSAKKSLGKKKEEPKKDGDTASSKKTVQTKAFVLAEVFPESFELDGQKYEIARDIANMGQLHDALEKEETLVFAMYWTKRHIKQFGYGVNALNAPKEFPMDLDLATCIYVSDECIVAYAVSAYTEACYMYLPADIEESSDGLRYANGVEFQIYRMV